MSERQRVSKSPIDNPAVLNQPRDYAKRVSFSRGMRVAVGDARWLFISGTASVDEQGASLHPGDFTAQTRRALANIAALLERENADWRDVVRCTCYLTDFRHYDAFNAVRNTFFDEHGIDPYPASTCVEARLCRPELLVEIEAIAIVPANR